ncbi:hypothetical protein BN159_7607 [Streptomyces davaonensis JCM 4913]|uniref:Uncharacterized protein n=1 Tax=Streptomyces davaonensis (strain DSM 101723 / JCM 4913 / KCC S-0913 / 768) TaxID=1214101 RepID=K4R6U4_STRDJ|nr:hypothetical protein BN159_7607 [Streptomyces davaonensis JCM 4913]
MVEVLPAVGLGVLKAGYPHRDGYGRTHPRPRHHLRPGQNGKHPRHRRSPQRQGPTLLHGFPIAVSVFIWRGGSLYHRPQELSDGVSVCLREFGKHFDDGRRPGAVDINIGVRGGLALVSLLEGCCPSRQVGRIPEDGRLLFGEMGAESVQPVFLGLRTVVGRQIDKDGQDIVVNFVQPRLNGGPRPSVVPRFRKRIERRSQFRRVRGRPSRGPRGASLPESQDRVPCLSGAGCGVRRVPLARLISFRHKASCVMGKPPDQGVVGVLVAELGQNAFTELGHGVHWRRGFRWRRGDRCG